MPNSNTAKRRIKKLDVEILSLVKKGANKKVIIYKSADEKGEPNISAEIRILKTDNEKHLVYGIVYSPEQVDTQGDIASAEVIEKAAHEFIKKGLTGNVDKDHTEITGDGSVVESWIVKKGDPTFPDEPEGSWAVAIKVENEDTWEEIKKGEITGLSLQALAVREEIAPEIPVKTKKSSKIKDFFTRLKKSFVDELKNDELEEKYRKVLWALSDSLWQALNDANVVDKKAAFIANCNQFIEYLNNEFTTTINKSGDSEMDTNEVTKIVKEAVEAALKPVNEELASIKKQAEAIDEIKKSADSLTTRLEKVEKSAPGSAQADTTGDKEPVKKGAESDSIWV